uniref:Uncharacterized protein n=1 Tax=Clytia hemisphaerica TaxID=252671 RepID=A0A7M6DRD7_9CNID
PIIKKAMNNIAMSSEAISLYKSAVKELEDAKILAPRKPMTKLEQDFLTLASYDICSGTFFSLAVKLASGKTCVYYFESGNFHGFMDDVGLIKLQKIFGEIHIPICCYSAQDIILKRKRNMSMFQNKRSKGIV